MPTYATASELRSYIGVDSTALPDATANSLIEKAEKDIDSIAVVDRPIDDATGLRFAPASLSVKEARILRRATCAQAEFRREMGSDFFVKGQYESVTGPDYSTRGRLGTTGPQVWKELAGSGFIRLSTTTQKAGAEWKPQPDFPVRDPRTEFERG
jgi:hypothetical protein